MKRYREVQKMRGVNFELAESQAVLNSTYPGGNGGSHEVARSL